MDTIRKLSETEKLYEQELAQIKQSLLHKEGDRIRISIKGLTAHEARKSILFEILSDFDFSSQSMEAIVHSLDGPSGRQFLSATHRVVRDREDLIITRLGRI